MRTGVSSSGVDADDVGRRRSASDNIGWSPCVCEHVQHQGKECAHQPSVMSRMRSLPQAGRRCAWPIGARRVAAKPHTTPQRAKRAHQETAQQAQPRP